jgi:cystathionine gamma-lyase
MGHVSSPHADIMAALRSWRSLAGAIPGPFESWLVHRGLLTLELRYERMCANAALLAERLETHPAVRRLSYPGLASHPGHAAAKRQMARFGFVIGLTLASREAAERFIAETRFLHKATSFGGVQTSAERRQRWGDKVADGFIRLSVGCEPAEALWDDMRRVLEALS